MATATSLSSSISSSHSEDEEWEYSSSMTISLDEVLPQKYQEEVSEEALAAIETAIQTTKDSLLESEENSDVRKILVKRLIKLRIRHEDVKERLTSKSMDSIETKGHTFVDTKDPNTSYAHLTPYWSEGRNKIYCQVCGATIRIFMQYSQHCRDCGFCVHHACIPYIKRECIAVKVRSRPDFILTICPEKSLPSLNYRCSECQVEFSASSPKLRPQLCDYTGLYYCSLCHWGAKGVTPARILQNWDFSRVSLCQASKQYLALMYKKPVIHVEKANPRLFAAVHELNEVRDLRRNLFYMKRYLEVCRFASDEKLLLELSDRQHFVDSVDHYSLEDLLDTESGDLLRYLERIHGLFNDHILKCVLCYARGFICELCKNGKEVLFPFSQDGYLCDNCNGVCHRYCYRANGSICPKCKRIQERKNN